MRYYIIAGEASGDLHASNLMKALKEEDAKCEFRCWGGDLMAAEGAELVKHYRDLAFMGFVEVLANLRTISRNLKFCKEDLLNYSPDALILIDYPGFNLRIAEFAKANNIKVIYYISPQIWAWKKSRVHKIKKTVDRMLCILPFEKDFYAKYDYTADFVGHPLLDEFEKRSEVDSDSFRKENQLDERPIIALLPGSRKQEISSMISMMIQMINEFADHQFIIAGAPSMNKEYYQSLINGSDVKILFGKTYDLLENSAAALVTSGTATLETALMGVPEIVCYKGNKISVQIARRIINVKYISLVNLIMDRIVVKELIQDDLNFKNLKSELDRILNNQEIRNKMLEDYNQLKEELGGSGASKNAAKIIVESL